MTERLRSSEDENQPRVFGTVIKLPGNAPFEEGLIAIPINQKHLFFDQEDQANAHLDGIATFEGHSPRSTYEAHRYGSQASFSGGRSDDFSKLWSSVTNGSENSENVNDVERGCKKRVSTASHILKSVAALNQRKENQRPRRRRAALHRSGATSVTSDQAFAVDK